MLLTVITPDTQTAMVRMLERELKDLDVQIVKRTWETGIPLAKGNYICLLERNSAVTPSTIRKNLQYFIDNPSYRKLAMVSPSVDFADVSDTRPLMIGYEKGLCYRLASAQSGVKTSRIGCVGGAIIRRSSLEKANVEPSTDLLRYSFNLSVALWNGGLRVSTNPDTIYYEPEKKKKPTKIDFKPLPVSILRMWEHEMIN